ncbi:MAG: glycosyltransferase family 4 protein [Alphaproteobacteria bacterium]|uniref:Putative glycosyltransferase n=1 Tax=viral metagenome TaxID=1070528 RepID=A0A6M3XDY8_9ZZZZ|nr:glycosyltransferase family 4 protein [Alphaproteobacteria bacterium]MBU1549463.1 glycosyltransferase family 4 protein [Alphaproteobacteria bacterium]MBU2337000.1 glycosyltransferase family 4 protein [Alphaproteobacteria bacterium]MBU2391439.1 glycosyltransferase family 4 protein [Alphaproteobacteria bacterium]
MTQSRKLLYFVSVDWFFCSHFMARARAARDAGFEVVVLTNVAQHGGMIEGAGLRVIHIDLDRRTLNPVSGLSSLRRVWEVLRAERPDILHQVALKPILIGSLAARLAGQAKVVNAIVGGGYLSTSDSLLAKGISHFLNIAMRLLLNPIGSRVIFENPDDLTSFVKNGWVKKKDAILIRGAGVDLTDYSTGDVVAEVPLVLLPARLLWDKGIGEFVEAARKIKGAGVSARFVVAGGADGGNRAAIDEATLVAWRNEGTVELWGFRTDMPHVFAQASIVCLPSYREGLPKALLEAMAASLPCVATDVPGCREAVTHGDNGLLVPPRDADSLALALSTLIKDSKLRQQMGRQGRLKAEREFSSEQIVQETLAVYKDLLVA